MPVPMHIEIIPTRAWPRCIALIRVAVRITPVAPSGWPSAIAPPWGFTFAGSSSSCRATARAWSAGKAEVLWCERALPARYGGLTGKVKVDLDRIRKNMKAILSVLPEGTRIIGVVKAKN